MAHGDREAVARALLAGHGRSYAEEAGIRLRDTPSPLYRLLVLSTLLSARISASIAVAAARELSRERLRSARAMAGSGWQQRVDALGRGGYRRYDERTATMLGDGAELVLRRWRGDLRRLHAEADGDVTAVRSALQQVPGIGPAGSAIFCREVQGVWRDVAPFADEKVQQGARALGLPTAAAELAGLVAPEDLPRLTAGCVRAALDGDVVTAVQEAVHG